MSSPSATLTPGTVIAGDFTIVRPLNEGGMGAVYVAMQGSTGRQRALKVMHREIVADPSHHRRFEQEARVGSKIRSDHVIEVIAAGVDPRLNLPYLVMELLEGEDLRHRLDARGALPLAEVAAIFEQTCHAMAAAHVAGVVHRDLKPENVFLAKPRRASSEMFTVKVLDFGIAKLAAEAGTRLTRGSVGSPLWMAPEQTTSAPILPAADVWALGLMAYELLCGRNFWRAANREAGTSAQLLREVVLDPIPRASERAAEQGVAERLPPAFDAWFARAVTREPIERFHDAGMAWRAMQRVFTGSDAFAETAAATPLSGGATESIAPSPWGTPASSPPATSRASRGDDRDDRGDRPRPSVAPPTPHSPSGPSDHPRAALPPETPIATAQPFAASAAPPPASRGVAFGVLIALGGVALLSIGAAAGVIGISLSRSRDLASIGTGAPSSTPPSSTPPAPAPAPAPASVAASTNSPSIATSTGATPTTARATPHGLTTLTGDSTAAPAPTAAPARAATLPGGFGDPEWGDHRGATTWKVQDRPVRLLTRLVENDSNVNDATVKKAVEWSSWEYVRCYERAFKTAKEMPEGTVTVGFEIINQLPRYGTLVSTTFQSKTIDDCVVNTLISQTINAAGPDGKGKVVYAFRFLP